MEFIKRDIDVHVPLTYWHHQGKADCDDAVLLLHGYTDSARSFARRLELHEQAITWELIAPNGLFPVPVRDEQDFRAAYSWYFISPSRKLSLIPPQVAVDALGVLAKELNLSSKKVTVVGFSQGGFLAPLLRKLEFAISAFIIIGSAYPPEHYENWPNIKIFGVHGELDETVPYQQSRAQFNQLMAAGVPGEFHTIPQMSHTITPEGAKLVRALIAQSQKLPLAANNKALF